MNAIKSKLYKIDPFESYEPNFSSFDRSGWGLHGLFAYLITRLTPKIIIEVGTWKGNSAIHMAEIASSLKLSTEIVCVDTFTGSPEHWIQSHSQSFNDDRTFSDYYDDLKITRGRPTLFEIFMNNCICAKVANRITPFPVSSDTAWYVLNTLGVKAEVIYVDAGHEYESASSDLNKFTRLLTDNGALDMDDYGGWPGVTEAVHEFIYRNPEYQFVCEFGKAVISKNHALQLSSRIVALQ